MLTHDDLIKIAMEPIAPSNEEADPRSPTRKVVDSITNAGAAVGGAVVGGIAGINSLDKAAPTKTIQ